MAIRNGKRDSATITENKYYPGILNQIRKLALKEDKSLTNYIFKVLKQHINECK